MKSHYEYKVQYEQHQPAEPELKTAEDRHRYAMFVAGNKVFKDGRTYIKQDENGRYISTFVSQYSNIIFRNVEPGVREVVFELQNKGYLTYTSCQGHNDSRHRYIGVVFNTLEQKQKFIEEINSLECDIYWYDEMINTIEKPSKSAPWWADEMTLHIVYDDASFEEASQLNRRETPYSEKDLTKFWNIQMCRSYDSYESIVFSFGYPIVEKNIWERIKKIFWYDHKKVTESYKDFLNKVIYISNYEG